MLNQFCLNRLKIQVQEIIDSIGQRPQTECLQTRRFNRMQYQYFLQIKGDIMDSINSGVELSDRVESMLDSWREDEERGHKFLDFCYGLRENKYTLAKGA